MKPPIEIENLLTSSSGRQRAGIPVRRPRTLAKIQGGKSARVPKSLGPDFLDLLFAEHKETDTAEIPRELGRQHWPHREALKDGRKFLREVSWDVYRVHNTRSLALALLLD